MNEALLFFMTAFVILSIIGIVGATVQVLASEKHDNEMMKLYVCFCEHYYTGEDVGQWYLDKPDETDKCHEQDGCGYYRIKGD